MSPDHEALVAVPTSQGYNLKKITTLMYAIHNGKHTELAFSDRRTYLVRSSLDRIEQKLSAFLFLRIHDRHLINLSFVQEYVSGTKAVLLMQNGEELEVSRVEDLNRILLSYKRKI